MQAAAAAGVAAPVILVLASNMDEAERTCTCIESANCYAMVSCSPEIALTWLIEHEGFFACVVVEPGPDAAHVVDLIAEVRDVGLEIPFLLRTAFSPAKLAEEGPFPVCDRFIHKIPIGNSALYAALRNLLFDATLYSMAGERSGGQATIQAFPQSTKVGA